MQEGHHGLESYSSLAVGGYGDFKFSMGGRSCRLGGCVIGRKQKVWTNGSRAFIPDPYEQPKRWWLSFLTARRFFAWIEKKWKAHERRVGALEPESRNCSYGSALMLSFKRGRRLERTRWRPYVRRGGAESQDRESNITVLAQFVVVKEVRLWSKGLWKGEYDLEFMPCARNGKLSL